MDTIEKASISYQLRGSQGYVKAEVPYFPALELCNGMAGVSSGKMRSVKGTNKVVRFYYRKVKCNSLLIRYTFAKVCKEKKSSLYSLFKAQIVQVCTQTMTC